MADANEIVTFHPENAGEARDFLQELKGRAKAANDAKNLAMFDLYNKCLATVAPQVTRFIERVEREERAALNKEHKALRKVAQAAKEAKKEAEGKAAKSEA